MLGRCLLLVLACACARYAPAQNIGQINALGVLNGNWVWGDATNNNALLSWFFPQNTALYQTAAAAVNLFECCMPADPATGRPAYYTQSFLVPGNPPGIPNYVANPAGTLAMLIDSAVEWKRFTGRTAFLDRTVDFAHFHLAYGLTPADAAWPSVPYASSTAGAVPYDGYEGGWGNSGGTHGVIEPDKVGELGHQLFRLYMATGDQAFLNAAVHNANVLSGKVQSGDAANSPWPFRVAASTGEVLAPYTANVIRPIELFDELIRFNIGNTDAYRRARDIAWNWLMSYPMQNNLWSNYFEDIPGDINNLNQYIPLETARYLLENRAAVDSGWLDKAQRLVAWVEANFAVPDFGAYTIAEQRAFFVPMGSHTARYGSVLALLAALTGDAAAKDRALRSLNWATYMLKPNGQVIVGPLDANQVWFTDGYGDYIRHFLRAMTVFPEWAYRWP